MFLSKKSYQICLAAGITLFSSLSFAQAPKTLSGFTPSVIPSEREALRLYRGLHTQDFRGRSGCFQRAHIWSYELFKRQSIHSMKVFLFFTNRYKREFDYEWTYHVAPLIPVRVAGGAVQEMVFDPTFVNTPSWETGAERNAYDNKPIPIAEWLKYFIFPEGVTCPLVENYEDYLDYQEKEYCYIMKTPMYTYIPTNFTDETEVRNDWRKGDLKQMKRAYKLENRF